MFFFLTSCNGSTDKKNINDEINKVDNSIKVEKDKFDNDLLNKQKIFLKYWSGMNYHDFFAVSNLLEKEGIVSKHNGDFYYNMGNSELRIDRYFSKQDYISYEGYTASEENNEISIGINLWGFDETTYNIFKKKYNLPNFIKKKSAEFILEENPLYLDENNDEYTIGRFIKSFDIEDNLEFIGGKENQLNYDPFFFDDGFASRITVPQEIIIKKDNIVIMINDVIDVSDPKTFNGYHKDKVSFLYFNNNKKEKYRIVRISNFSDLRITYIDRTYYEKIEKKEKKSEINDLNLKIKEKNQIKRRTNSIQNEI
jgi:hypothetical protein